MRLWHQNLITKLPRAQLLGQHRECCALRGNGWLKKHSTVQYIFNYSRYHLFKYHELIMEEMTYRGYKVSKEWYNSNYCGKQVGILDIKKEKVELLIYPEHNQEYYQECIKNLKQKGIEL